MYSTEKKDEGDTASVKSNESGTKKSAKKAKTLRVLDGKAGQALSILLGSVSIIENMKIYMKFPK